MPKENRFYSKVVPGETLKIYKVWGVAKSMHRLYVGDQEYKTADAYGHFKYERKTHLNGTSGPAEGRYQVLLSERCCVQDDDREKQDSYQGRQQAIKHVSWSAMTCHSDMETTYTMLDL